MFLWGVGWALCLGGLPFLAVLIWICAAVSSFEEDSDDV